MKHTTMVNMKEPRAFLGQVFLLCSGFYIEAHGLSSEAWTTLTFSFHFKGAAALLQAPSGISAEFLTSHSP